MLELNKEKNKLEGELKLSDCEGEYVVKWLSGRSQASFFIGDSDEERSNVKDFIDGNKYCFIDLPSFLIYLETIEHIVKKYKSMFYGPFDNLSKIYHRFSLMKQDDARIVLSYVYPDRYIRILNNKKGYSDNVALYGDLVLQNGDEFRHSYMGEVTRISIQKNADGKYWMYIYLIDNWRDVIMQSNGVKVTLESLINIFNSDIDNSISEGKSEAQSAEIFGIKYAPLLEKNKSKFTYIDIVNGSAHNNSDVLDAVEHGISISSAVIWSPDLSQEAEGKEENNEDYQKFKNLLAWFVKQLNINNDLETGTKTSGKGCDGDAIQTKYAEWRDYGSFTLDCTIQSGYLSTSSKVNYIHKSCTGINVRPNFDKTTKEITFLGIDLYNTDSISEEISKILDKEFTVSELSLFDGLEPNDKVKELFDDYCKVIDAFTAKLEDAVDYDNCDRLPGGSNIILYGVPGAGKSWTIENFYKDAETITKRVVFHPDYTYSDFVGQILPKSINGNVTYDFIPGPFTEIVNDAYHNPNKKFILVIEEINRGNAPAIFGDIFQLLDRDEKGRSAYEIANSDVAKVVYKDENHPVYLPSNLSIICTMNTSDQNVFTLDTAFQRRWNMRLIENVFKKDTPKEKDFAKHPILDSTIKWEAFCETINAQILDKNQNMTSSEDKRLGTHFVTIEDLTFDENERNPVASDGDKAKAILNNRRFPEKVIKYLWDDAFKFYRDEIFKGEYNSLEKVIREFTTRTGDDRFSVFKDNIKAAIDEANKK